MGRAHRAVRGVPAGPVPVGARRGRDRRIRAALRQRRARPAVRRARRHRGVLAPARCRERIAGRGPHEAGRAGYTHAALDTDADNPTGAAGIYAKVGFVAEQRVVAFRKPV